MSDRLRPDWDALDLSRRPLLVQAAPALAARLVEGLIQEGEPALADQVSTVRIVRRCSCGQGDCDTFHTIGEGEERRYSHTVPIENSVFRFLTVDVDRDGRIIGVEVLV